MKDAQTRKKPLSQLEREVLQRPASSGPQELEGLAANWWRAEITTAAAKLEALFGAGHVRGEHLYSGQLLFQKVDPKSPEARALGARSFYQVTSDGRRALKRWIPALRTAVSAHCSAERLGTALPSLRPLTACIHPHRSWQASRITCLRQVLQVFY